MSETNDPLHPLREKIDELDHRIVELLNARARIVVDIGKIKHRSGSPVYAPDREKVVLERIRAANKAVGGPLANSCLEAIYRELMSGSFALEKPLRIANSLQYAGCKSWVPLAAPVSVQPSRQAMEEHRLQELHARIRQTFSVAT